MSIAINNSAAGTDYIHQIQVGTQTYNIVSKYIWDGVAGSTTSKAYSWADISSLVTTSFSIKKYDTLPTASVDTTREIALIPSADGVDGNYDEYVTVTGGTAQTPTYTWELVGTTKVELEGLQTNSSGGQTVNTSNSGSQTATGSATISYDKAKANTGYNTATTASGTATITYKKSADATGEKNGTTSSNTGYATSTGTFSGSTDYTPGGSVGSHSHSIGSSTASIYQITGVGTTPALTVTNKTVATNGIQSYSGSFSKLTTATGYGTGTTSVTPAAAAYGFSTSQATILTTATVNNGVLSWNSVAGTKSAQGTAVTVSNGTSFTYATGALATNSTGGQVMVGLGTAVAADTTTVGSASGWSAGTAPSRSSITVVTSVDANTGNKQPSWSGTAVTLTISGNVSMASHSHTYTAPAAHTHAITLTDTSVTGTAAVSVASHSHAIDYTSTSTTGTASVAVTSHTHSVTVASHTHQTVA